MILFIDNFDSFTYNLVQYLQMLEQEVRVIRNNAFTISDLSSISFDSIIISPGPGTPSEAGRCKEVITHYAGKVPILGVCLGHQCINEVFGGATCRAKRPMHGKTSPILHRSQGIFSGLPSPFEATRYHSLVADPEAIPDCLEVTAETSDGEVMALRHKELPVEGVQFHPESIISQYGMDLLSNFLKLSPLSGGILC